MIGWEICRQNRETFIEPLIIRFVHRKSNTHKITGTKKEDRSLPFLNRLTADLHQQRLTHNQIAIGARFRVSIRLVH